MTAQNVWESNFKAVLHLPETSGTHYDSTPNSNIGTPQGGVTQGDAGKVDGADTFDGISGYINYGTSTSLNFGVNSPFTFEGWVKTTESYGAILSQRHDTDGGAVIDVMLGYDGAVRSAGSLMGLVRQSSGSSGYARVTGPIVNDGNWHYFTLTRNSGNTIELFVDGISQGTASGSESGGTITTNLRALGSERIWVQAGFGTADDRYLNGAIDEVRTSNIQRSAAWIKASYESERDYFVRWGNQGTLSGWGYRKSHVINPSPGAGTNYQVRITAYYGSGTDSEANVYLNGKSRTDFGDVRFTDDDGTTLLDYWIESKVDGDNAVFWVEVADDLSTEDQTIYVYYGKSDATTTSNGTNTFNFFDDFSGDLSKWSREKTSGVYPQIENGYMRAGGGTTSSPYGHTSLGSSPTYSAFLNNAVLYRARMSLNGIGEVAFRGNFAANTGYKDRHDQRSGQGQSFLKPPYSGWGFITGAGADGKVPSADVWYTFEITAVGDTFKLYRDGVLKRTATDTQYSNAGEIALQNHYGSYTDYDWVAVRKYVSPEPSHGSWGSEDGVSATYYVLRIYNTVADPWRIRLRTYSDSNVNRLGNCTIYLHNGGTSRQIYINGGSYVQQVGDWYDLAASGTDYIAVSVSANSQGTSIIYAYLEVIISNSGVSMLYKITFNVT